MGEGRRKAGGGQSGGRLGSAGGRRAEGRVSRRGCTADQWIVFDLGREVLVREVRTRGHDVNTAFNPRAMCWQRGRRAQTQYLFSRLRIVWNAC
ncbi:unnamed protein product [Prorocentrum cordatum]|uniref:Uncharacterized protein n=1 Tax=Prorocentrum cordatum TaxID=2364126 RepID=A0ABN9TQ94_9DINO|nr:unnamed protein product [Polarella glacialis]